MTFALVAGATLAFVVGVFHSWLGERYILVRLFRRENLPHLFGSDWFTKRTLRFAWHLTSVAWWGFGGLFLAYLALGPVAARDAALKTIAATFLISAILSAGFTRGRHLSWPLFLGIALAAWLSA